MVRRWALGVLIWAALVHEAGAGAWTLREGQGQVIMSTSRKIAPIGGFFGDPVETDENSTQIFAEFGVNDELTLGITIYGAFSTIEDDVEASLGIHARHKVWTGEDGDVLSVQGGVRVPVERWLGEGLGDSRPDSVTEVNLRVLYGRGWQTDWGNSFVNAELGLNLRGEGLDEEVQFDFTIGHEPIRGLLGLLSVYTSVPLGNQGEASVKFAPSVAYTFWPWLGENDKKPYGPINPNTVQLGVEWNALALDDEMTASVSIWKGF